jgi:hypothetical protein
MIPKACKLFMIVIFTLCAVTSRAGSARKGSTDLTIEAALDPNGDNSDPQYGLLIGAGYFVMDNIAFGIYGTATETDRETPAEMDWIWGLGCYYEYCIDVGRNWCPYFRSRVGLLEGKGIEDTPLLHLATSVGIRQPIDDSFVISYSADFHWADEEVFDSDVADDGISRTEDTDVTANVSVRYTF